MNQYEYDTMPIWSAMALVTLIMLAILICSMEARKTVKKPRKRAKPVLNDFSVVWLEQSRGHYTLDVTLKTDMAKSNTTTQVRYLQSVFDDIFVNLIGGYYRSFKVAVAFGDKSVEFTDFGCFTPAKLILFLLEMGVQDAFKADAIRIDLLDMY